MRVLNFIFCFLLAGQTFSQDAKVSPLFQVELPLEISLKASIKQIKKNTNDSTYLDKYFLYKGVDGEIDSLSFQLKSRGNFRFGFCYFPPLKIKIKKRQSNGTPFEGNKNLKLVLPCLTFDNKNDLILKEYLCYRFYELVTPYHFKTRLTNINFIETSKRKRKTFKLLGFFVEDNKNAAKRNECKVIPKIKIRSKVLEPINTVRHDFFQFMIGNVDWSSGYQHNSNILMTSTNAFIPLAYDFDMSGFVNAPYARENTPVMANGDITNRVYRGFCRNRDIMHQVRKEYLNLEPSIFELLNSYRNQFSKIEYSKMENYLKSFYSLLHNDKLFERRILNRCRTNK